MGAYVTVEIHVNMISFYDTSRGILGSDQRSSRQRLQHSYHGVMFKTVQTQENEIKPNKTNKRYEKCFIDLCTTLWYNE